MKRVNLKNEATLFFKAGLNEQSDLGLWVVLATKDALIEVAPQRVAEFTDVLLSHKSVESEFDTYCLAKEVVEEALKRWMASSEAEGLLPSEFFWRVQDYKVAFLYPIEESVWD